MEPKAVKPVKAPRKRKPVGETFPVKLTKNAPEYVQEEDGKVYIKYDAISIDMAPLGYVVAVFTWKGESAFTIGPFNLTPGTALHLAHLQGRAEVTLKKQD